MDKYKELQVEIGKGWERENRKHFDEIVLNYDKSRWDYPDELFDDIFDYTGAENRKNALEIGAGTGIATAPFLKAGYNVTAVEMGENMTAFLLDRFREYSSFSVITSVFEDAELKNNNYDLIYAASVFHWVDAEVGCPKAYDLLRNGGAIALFRSNNAYPTNMELFEDLQKVYKKYYHKPYVRLEKTTDFWTPREILRGFGFENLEDYGFTDISMKLYEGANTYDASMYITLMDTMSDHRSLPDDDREALYDGIGEAINKHGGTITIDRNFQLYMGKKS